jgi:hypothetical protein
MINKKRPIKTPLFKGIAAGTIQKIHLHPQVSIFRIWDTPLLQQIKQLSEHL